MLALHPFARGNDGSNKPVRIGFIGVGNRGTGLLQEVLRHPDVTVPAVCDIDEKALNRALDIVEKSRGSRPAGYQKGPEDYRRLLKRDDLDAVLIATPQESHAVMSIDAMRAGKFVGAEVPACCTVEECRELLKVQRETNAGYMMLENLLYLRSVMQVEVMAQRGAFGELTYGAGNYIHEIRAMRFNDDGSLTWRGQNIRDNAGIIYPTHAIGPVCRWMGINAKDDGDRLVSMVGMSSKPAATHAYAVERFGASSEAAKVEFRNGDTNHALIKTAKGRLIEMRYDTASPRPAGLGQYSLQGTRGAYEASRGQRMVYLEGRTSGERWEELEKYAGEFDHPRWRANAERASSSGHNGADFFVIEDFINAIRTGVSPIDVLDAVTWSVIRPLSAESLAGGSKPVAIPEFA